MNVVSKKKTVRKARPDQKKSPTEVKNIGLEEQIEEARRLYRMLENPELLKSIK